MGGTNSTLIHQLQIIQNLIRLINFKCLKDHVEMTTLYKSINILKISDIYELQVAKFIHSYNQKRFPEHFNMSFKPTNQFHNYQTRSLTNENFFNGLKIWNKIFLELKKLSKQSFSKWFKINKIININSKLISSKKYLIK